MARRVAGVLPVLVHVRDSRQALEDEEENGAAFGNGSILLTGGFDLGGRFARRLQLLSDFRRLRLCLLQRLDQLTVVQDIP